MQEMSQNQFNNDIRMKVADYFDMITKRILSELGCEDRYEYIKMECVSGYDTQLSNIILNKAYEYFLDNKQIFHWKKKPM